MAERQLTFDLLYTQAETHKGGRKRCKCSECKHARRKYHLEWVRKRVEKDPEYHSRIWKLRRSTPELYARDRASAKKSSKRPKERARCVAKSRKKFIERRDMLAEIKMSRGCKDCGYREHPSALDFDHVSGNKFMGVSQMGTFSLKRIMEEAHKCEVVCLNCHRIRSRKRLLNDEVAWASKRSSNPTKRQAECHARRERGKAFLNDLKLTKGCADCGHNGNPESLDFDHVIGKKRFDLSTRTGNSIALLTEEIAKCDVVCANCHRIRTFERRRAMTAVT